MGIIELVILSIGLSMDSFSVAICKGLTMKEVEKKHMCIAGIWFGGAQFLMPLIGHFFANLFADLVESYSQLITFILLMLLTIRKMKYSRQEEMVDSNMNACSMLILAVATSLDSLVIGVAFAFLHISVVPSACIIGLVTFIFSAYGIKNGVTLGKKGSSRAQSCGGLILLIMGFRVLLQAI